MQIKEVSDTKKLLINLFASIFIFCVNAVISFFLSPFIVRTLGVEAAGFTQLAANFASYISLITIALNSMSGRFITIALTKGDKKKAISYYTSVFWANLALFVLLLLPIVIVIFKLDSLINIPIHLVRDVKTLFSLAFANLMAVNLLSLWNNTYYAINRLYLQYIGDAVAAFIKVALIVALFSTFKPHIWYILVAGIAILPLSATWGLWNKNRFLPDLCINRKMFSLTKLKEILSSGIWRSIQSAGEMLLTGLDLLICNIFINPVAMGVLALSKTLPSMIQQLNWQIAASFGPKLTISYAKNEKDIIWNDLKRSFKISAIIGPIPLAGLIVFGRDFFALWVPNQDAAQLQILSILACFWMALISGIQPIGNVFATVNKVKQQAISVIISGILNVLIVMVVLHFTDLGIYAIAGASVAIGLLRNLCYTIPASALYLGFKWHDFYIGVLYSAITTTIVTAIGFCVKLFITPTTWIAFLISCAITGVIALTAGSLIILNKQERKTLFNIFRILSQRFKGEIYG